MGEAAARQKPDGTDLARQVHQDARRFGGAVELTDLRDPEALGELLPDVGSESVADGDAQPVVPLCFVHFSVEEVAAQLTDVDHGRGAISPDVGPEGTGTEAVA